MASEKKQRPPSSGTIALVESGMGNYRLVVDLDEQDGTDAVTLARIRAGIAGLSYLFEQDGANIEKMGMAYIQGMEAGIGRMRKQKKKKTGNYKDSKIGFHSK
jgi:hypothetical protein